MIEVEKKFQPTDEQLAKLLENSHFVKEVVNHDIYFDYPDYRLLKARIRLRSRNGSFELKIGKPGKNEGAEEIEIKEEIEKYFNTDNLEEFMAKNLHPVIDYKTKRNKYKNGEFAIDVDEMSFGYSLCEIELLVENEEQINEAQEKIFNFAKAYDFEIKELPSKRGMYLQLTKPEVYKEIFG